jgi:hypothetical protein
MPNKYLGISLLVFASFISGCANTSGSHHLVSGASQQLSNFSDLIVSVKPSSSANLTQTDTDRMSNLIVADIQAENPTRFKSINAMPINANSMQASVDIKTYDEGNAFARAMLAGLGQIHIDADVTLIDYATKAKLAQYEVSKTFAWGGLYGGFTSIKDAEVGFCKAVADSILNKE